jgi:uncharacterized membrane protein YccC
MFAKFFDAERLTHSFKTAIACVIGLLFSRIVGFSTDQWIIITIIVVMCAQIYVGGVMQKAYLRFLGTLIGCLIAALTLVFIGHSDLAILISISLSGFLFSYFIAGQENYSYAGTLGAVTTTIIMLGQDPTLGFAAERFLEISAGLLIATLVSQFILPIHARTHLRRAQVATLEELRYYYSLAMNHLHQPEELLNYQELDESIVKTLLKQRQLAKDSSRELLGLPFNPDKFLQILYAEREMLRAITFMHAALAHIKEKKHVLIESNALMRFNDEVLQSLAMLISSISQKKPAHTEMMAPSYSTLESELYKNLVTSSQAEWVYISGVLFSAKMLTDSLNNMKNLYQI